MAATAPCSTCRLPASPRPTLSRKESTTMSSRDDLPPALRSMWRALKRGYEAEPRFLVVAFGLSLLSALPDALLALWLKLLADGLLSHSRGLVIASAVGLGLSVTGTWFLRVLSERTQRRFR